MAAPPSGFVGREKSAYCVMGKKLFIFGGLDASGNALNSAAVYDPTRDSWAALSTTAANLPSKRQLATAAWSGSSVYVLFGANSTATTAYGDGDQYNPTTDAWTTVPTSLGKIMSAWAAPTPTYLMIWSGLGTNGAPTSSGGVLNYTSGASWTPVSTTYPASAPQAVTDAAWAYSSNAAFLFGGQVNGTTATNKGYYFSFATTTWTQLTNTNGPAARWGALAVFDGTIVYLWGGRNDTTAMNDLYTYDTSWASLGATGAPSPRWAPNRSSGWAFAFGPGDIAIIGGLDPSNTPLTDGARFVQSTGTWTPITSWTSLEDHQWGAAGLVGGEIFIWGGRTGTTITATGERYLP
jgi:N-acetylneuraminic acid mutarotase